MNLCMQQKKNTKKNKKNNTIIISWKDNYVILMTMPSSKISAQSSVLAQRICYNKFNQYVTLCVHLYSIFHY